jgi:uncharacterized protein
MKLLVKDISEGCSHFSESEEPAVVGLEAEPDAEFNAPLKIEVDITREGNEYYVRGTVATLIRVKCARCLGPAEVESVGEFEGIFGWRKTAQPFLDISLDSDMHKFGGPELDIGPLIREAVLMTIPIAALCCPDCAGLCPQCGADLNQGKCSCQPAEFDPRWSQLKNLLDDK